MRRQPEPRIDLYCFPHAGGTAASYARWQEALGGSIQVIALQMPGRAERILEAPFESMAQMALATTELIARNVSRPIAFFGHSMGSLVAFETALLLQKLHCVPTRIFASACAAPGTSRQREGLHTLDDDCLIGKLTEYGGTPDAVAQNRDLMELALPGVRADFRIVDEYTPQPAARISAPVSVMAGTSDHTVQTAELDAWANATYRGATVKMFEGGHFYLHDESQFLAVVDHIKHELETNVSAGVNS